jgi:hypothetical protein
MFKFVLQNPGSNQASISTATVGECGEDILLTVVHDRTCRVGYAYIPCLLLELTHSALLDSFIGIDEASRHFNDDFIDWRPVLLLKEELRAAGFVQNGYNSDTIYLTVCRSSLFHRNKDQ